VVAKEAAMRVNAAEKEDMEYIQKLKDHGLTIVDLADDPAKLAAAKKAARTCWVKLDDIVGKVWMDKIRKAVSDQ